MTAAAVAPINARAEDLALDMRLLAMLPRHMEAPQWKARIEKVKTMAPELWALADLIAKEDPDYLHTDPPQGHVVSVVSHGSAKEMCDFAIYQEACSCGWRGERWKPGFGPEPGTILRGARK